MCARPSRSGTPTRRSAERRRYDLPAALVALRRAGGAPPGIQSDAPPAWSATHSSTMRPGPANVADRHGPGRVSRAAPSRSEASSSSGSANATRGSAGPTDRRQAGPTVSTDVPPPAGVAARRSAARRSDRARPRRSGTEVGVGGRRAIDRGAVSAAGLPGEPRVGSGVGSGVGAAGRRRRPSAALGSGTATGSSAVGKVGSGCRRRRRPRCRGGCRDGCRGQAWDWASASGSA